MLHLRDAPWVCVSSSETKQQQIDSARDSVCSVSLTHQHASECARWHTLEEHLWSCVWRKRIVCVRRFWCQQLRGKQLTHTHTHSRAWGHVWTRSCDLWTDRRRWRRAGDEERRARSRTDRWGRSRLTPDLGEWTSQTHTNTHTQGENRWTLEPHYLWSAWAENTEVMQHQLEVLLCRRVSLSSWMLRKHWKFCLDKVSRLSSRLCDVVQSCIMALFALRHYIEEESVSVSILEIRTKANETEGCRATHISSPDCIDSKLIFTLTHVEWCQQIGLCWE